MIKSFKNKDTKRLFSREKIKKLPPNVQRVALRKLLMIHAARNLDDLRSPPGNRLELLKGARAGQRSVRINDQWRVCFEWCDGDAYNVEICDDH